MKILITNQFHNKTLDYFLNYYKQSKKNKYLLFNDKRIKVNNEPPKLETMLKQGDIINIDLIKEEIDYVIDDDCCEVVYEDEYLLVVNKPYGIIVHGDKDKKGSLANMVAKYYKDNNYHLSIRHLHRLDKETQGLVIFSKNSFFQPYFDYLLSNKLTKRYYKAIVLGKCNKSFTVDKPIGRDRHNSKKYRVSKTGSNAITHVKPLKRKAKYSLIECELETGRTHQIRVHLASENIFIVNDNLYGIKSDDFKYMGLYAYKLEWNDILSNKKITVELPQNSDLDYFKVL